MKDPPWFLTFSPPIIKVIDENGIEKEQKTIFQKKGSSTTLRCYPQLSNGNSSVSWYFALPTDPRPGKLIESDNVDLKINQAALADAGIYTCSHSIASSDVSLSVYECEFHDDE
ncbi:hypothetical protein Ciccas_008679 [Cichlidogyrus casuarinus]|uniref:Ig-like domain-containing protein n=1 Tax=Cichlidogyrus casuarinus TaxID=1844966 RepID=A0ABD2PZE0_9PLAT